MNEKIDIDKLLVVTFTNAAASEMRSRIMEAIYKYLEQHPEDEHMQKQTILMEKSNICTIHSFCLDVIKNHFYEIDISPNFRIGNQSEIELLVYEVLEELFEEKYETGNEDFLKLINTYTSYRNDDNLKEIILKIYKFAMSSPFPEEWLQEKIEIFNNNYKDFKETAWGEILINEFKDEIYSYILQLKAIKNNLDKYSELVKFSRNYFKGYTKFRRVTLQFR